MAVHIGYTWIVSGYIGMDCAMMRGTRVLITGAHGLLGKYLLDTSPTGMHVIGSYHEHAPVTGLKMNITRYDDVLDAFQRFQPDIVIHCAAYGSVDYCERHEDVAREVNVGGTETILRVAEAFDAKVVYISSNAVYDGDIPPYFESSTRNPVNVYGRLKVEAEDAVRIYNGRWMIVRPIMLYGWPNPGARGNWVTRAVSFMADGMPVHVVSDVITMPTYAKDLATIIWKLLELHKSGEWNIGGYERMHLYMFITDIARVWGFPENLVKIVPPDHFKDLAPRPIDTSYDMSKLWNLEDESLRPSSVLNGLRSMWNAS